MFLNRGDLAIEAAEKVDEGGIVLEMCFGVIGGGEFPEEDLGEACGGGLHADFAEFVGIVTAEEIDQVILIGAVLEYMFLGERPFEIAAGCPVGNIAFSDGETEFGEGADDVLVGN